MNKLLIVAMTATGLLAGALPATAQNPQYTYGSELMNVQERLGHREIMRRLPPAQREAYRREHHQQMMERAQALGYAMPPEPPEVRAGAGRWIHSPSQAYKPVEPAESVDARRESHSPGLAQAEASAPRMDVESLRYPSFESLRYPSFMGYMPEPPTPPTPPSPPSMHGGPYGPGGFGGPMGGYPGWYGPGQSGYGYPAYGGPGYGGGW